MARLQSFAGTLRGRALMMAAAIAVTVVVFTASAVIAVRADAAEDRAADRLVQSVRIAEETRATYAELTRTISLAATMRDSGQIAAAFAVNARFDAQLGRLGALAADDPVLQSLYDGLMGARARAVAFARPYIALVMAGQFEDAETLARSPAFAESTEPFLPALQSVLNEALETAHAARAASDRGQKGALALAGLGFLMVVTLWGGLGVDWASQTRAAHRIQHRLAEMNNELERRVAQRTAELDVARLRAEQANRAKSEFLAAMSHELRTPLNGVLGMATVLQRSQMSEAQKSMVQVIETSGRALLALLNDVLDHARLEAGQMTLRSEPFDLTELLEQAAARHGKDAERKGLRLSLQVAPGARQILVGDEGRVAQALHCLLSNAVKFTDAGAVTLTADRRRDALRVAVRDTGCGVPPELAGAIFERFSQGDNSARRRHGGTGLGLALARELVTAMGGRIGVEFRPGEGSEFWFELTLERWVPAAERGQAA